MYPSVTSWLYLTTGTIIGGAVIRYFGFQSKDGFMKYMKLCLFHHSGVAVSFLTACVLRVTRISKFFEKHRRLSLMLSTVGLFWIFLKRKLANRNLENISPYYVECIMFWQIPSLYLCTFNCSILAYTLQYALYAMTICFTTGAIMPTNNTVIEDIGLKIIRLSPICFACGLLLLLGLQKRSSNYLSFLIVLNGSLIILIIGFLIDDIQHTKILVNSNEGDGNLAKFFELSAPLFIETAFMFGRIASLMFSIDQQIAAGIEKH